MQCTTRIERGRTTWTSGLTLHVGRNGQFMLTRPAQNRRRGVLGFGPYDNRMISKLVMAGDTGIVCPATFELDRHQIIRTVVVPTAGTVRHLHTVDDMRADGPLHHHVADPPTVMRCMKRRCCGH